MRRAVLILFTTIATLSCWGQREDFSYKFYGFVRGDLFYNSRSNVEAIDGIFYLYPENKRFDADGKDLNATPNSGFYSLTARLGMDIQGPRLGNARTSAKVEADFGGNGSAPYLFRMRHAYLNLAWDKGSSVLLGQTWHPLWDIFPETLNMCTGSPFQPFNRSTQIRYQYTTPHIRFTGAAVYQLMSLSPGPGGKNEEYIKNGIIPELFAGINYYKNGFVGGVGIEMISLKPRTESKVGDKIYKVDERITTFSYMAQAKYTTQDWSFSGKTLIASNLSHTNMLGGYGVSAIEERTGKQDYTASRYSTSWLNVVYGRKWQYGLFGGYSKNLGTKDALLSTSDYYGSGIDIDKLISGMAHISYNLSHWKAGVEYNVTTAWYGDTELSSGKVKNTDAVTNHRILFLLTYHF